jgi:hypothetical protein
MTAGLYHKIPVQVHAVRWFHNGDHPEDGPPQYEGKVVRYYRHPEVQPTWPCPHCMNAMLDHGWVDSDLVGYIVCPGDWIVTDAEGDRYPVTNDSFTRLYEPAPAVTE